MAIFYDTNVLLGYVFEWDDWNYPSSIAFDDERKKYWSKTVHKEFNDKFKEFSEEAKRFLNELKFKL